MPFALLLVLLTTAADPVQVTCRRENDRATVVAKPEQATIEIASPTGISAAKIERTGADWPAKVAVKLKLRGLEFLTVASGATKIKISVNSGDGAVRVSSGDDKETPLAADDPLRPTVRRLDGKEGFEIDLPAAFFKENPRLIELHWIDFYR